LALICPGLSADSCPCSTKFNRETAHSSGDKAA
jgi:hypothetical protein